MSRPTFNLGVFLEKEKLKSDGSNFVSWHRHLRILLSPNKLSYLLDVALGDALASTVSADEQRVYQTKKDDSEVVQSGMFFCHGV